jgi:hypothetical protein
MYIDLQKKKKWTAGGSHKSNGWFAKKIDSRCT